LLWEGIPLLGAVPPLWSMLVGLPCPASMLAMLFAVWVSDCVIVTVLPSPVSVTFAVLLPLCVLLWESIAPVPLLVLPVPVPELLLVGSPALFEPVCVLLWVIVTALPVPAVALPVPVLVLGAPIVTVAVLLPV
jgi:hypothetical protein